MSRVELPTVDAIETRRGRVLAASEIARMEDRRIVVKCPWMDCESSTEVYRSQSAWGGRRGLSAVFCNSHRALVKNLLGTNARMNGFGRVFANIDRVYATRTVQAGAPRVVIFEMAGRKCAGCQTPLVFSEQGKSWHIDHVLPVYLGGLTTLKNLQPLCRSCHRGKTAIEIKAIRSLMPNTSRREWATHAMKDAEIARLKDDVAALTDRIQALEAVR